MKVVVARSSGFCQGVKRAVDTALSVPTENTYVLGELIHNPKVVERISNRGIQTVESVFDVPNGATLLIRSHGVGREIYEQCREKDIRVVDCTCQFVANTQAIVDRESKAGKTVVIVGHPEHPEVKGLVGWSGADTFVFSSEDADFSHLAGKSLAIVAQTTFSNERFSKITENIKKHNEKTVEIFPTICYTTVRRQKEAEELARLCDAVLVIGGLNSSNTNKLYEIASQFCSHVYRLNSADDFDFVKLKNFLSVGVIAGASTPDWQTQEVLFKMEENNAEVKSTMQEAMDEMNKVERYKKGQIITTKIVAVQDAGLYVQGSGKLEMLVEKENLDCEEYSKDAYKVNDEIELMVVSVNPMKLSQKMVKKVKEEEAMLAGIEAGEIFTVTCTGSNKGGLTAELGTYPVFVPAKEIRSGYVKDLDKYVGKTLRLKLIEIRRERRKEIIASQRVILEAEKAAKDAERAAREQEFFDAIHVGDVVDGKVERATAFGAFVSVNGFDCLAHISDLSWTSVKNVTDVLEIGKHYDFEILNINREAKKVSIGYKQLQPQPWELAAEKYAAGDVVHGKVVRIVPFGAFVELEKGIDGLVHVSQISHEWLENPTSVLTIGQEIDAKILAFDPENRKITLSIKALEPKPEMTEVKTEGDKPVKARRSKKASANGGEEEEYREWNEGGLGGVAISELLAKEDE